MSAYEPLDLPDDLQEEEPTTEIVQWYDDPPWGVQFVPTAVAFTAGVVAGGFTTLLAIRLLNRGD